MKEEDQEDSFVFVFIEQPHWQISRLNKAKLITCILKMKMAHALLEWECHLGCHALPAMMGDTEHSLLFRYMPIPPCIYSHDA